MRAQERPTTEPLQPAQILVRLASRDTSLVDLRLLAAQLDDQPLAVRSQRFLAVQRRYAAELQFLAREQKRLLPRFAKAVPKAQRNRLGRRGEEQVAALRQRLLAISRSEGLSKQRIGQEIDPLLQQLQELLLPTADQVAQSDSVLQAGMLGIAQIYDDLPGFYELYLDCRRELDEEPAGRLRVDQLAEEPPPPEAAAWLWELEMTLLVSLPLSARDQKVLTTNAGLLLRMDREEFLGTLALNRIRIAVGLPLLAIDEKLAHAARDHSVDMKNLGFFSHTSPVEGKRSFGDRCARAGTSGSAENIAAGQSTGEGAIRAWWYSPGHHKNMLGNHQRTGLGRCDGLWTQLFGG